MAISIMRRLVVIISLTTSIARLEGGGILQSTQEVSDSNISTNINNDNGRENTLFFRNIEGLDHKSDVNQNNHDLAPENMASDPLLARRSGIEDPPVAGRDDSLSTDLDGPDDSIDQNVDGKRTNFDLVTENLAPNQLLTRRTGRRDPPLAEQEYSLTKEHEDSLPLGPIGLEYSLPVERQGLTETLTADQNGLKNMNGQRSSLFGVPWWPFLLTKVAYAFRGQRRDRKSQFGAAFMACIDKLQDFHLEFLPHNKDGSPYIDNKGRTSPEFDNMTNFVVSKAENVSGSMLHAVDRILKDLQYLNDTYSYHFGNKSANLILLYWWIMPSPDAVELILCHLKQGYFANFRYKVLVYTQSGTSALKYMKTKSNDKSRKALQDAGIEVFKHTCEPSDETESTNYVFSQQGKEAKRVPSLTSSADLHRTHDDQVCKLGDTLQGCMVECLGSNICCSCKKSGKKAMAVAAVNQIAKNCAIKKLRYCTVKWVKNILDSTTTPAASSCINSSYVVSTFHQCATKCNGRPLSKPLDPTSPSTFPGCLTDFSDLANPPEVDLTEFCQDMRTDGFLCTKFRSDSFTAGNTLCRPGNRCGIRHNEIFSWCFVNWDNDWDYCCHGSCGFHGRDYEWCLIGLHWKWQYCGNAGHVTVNGRRCLAEHPCGLHNEDYMYSRYYWCYTDTAKSWGRCCQPGKHCDKSGYCYTGYKTDTDRMKCHKSGQ